MSHHLPPSSDWPRRLGEALSAPASAIRELAARFLARAQDGPAVLLTDAARLDRASADLDAETQRLRTAADSTAEVMRQTRHDLMNVLNRVSGYSQLLLEAEEEEEWLGPSRPDLERVRDLGRDCERLILQLSKSSLATTASGPQPGSWHGLSLQASVLPSTILVVDDDEAGRTAVVRALRAQGHTLIEAGDGLVAIELIQQRGFDLVLLDIDLPGKNGYQVLRAIRADTRRDSMPVLMVSGLDEIANTVRCIEAGAEDFLPKPVDHILLRARTNSLLARRQSRVRELEQFFPPEVARQLLDQPEVLEEGHQTDITVLFCDIRGYSRISRRLGPAQTIEWVSSVMEELTDCILERGGVLVDFIGDELMAMWGAPGEQSDHAELACRAGLEMLARLPGLNAAWQGRLGEPMDFGVGLNSGIAWVGNSGTRRKFKYGPSGDTVNVGSRVQGATKYLKAPLIVSKATHDRLGGRFLSRRLGRVKVVNLSEPVELYQIVADGTPGWAELKTRYEQALDLYELGEVRDAARQLGGMIAEQGAEGPPLGLMARAIEALIDRERWSAVFELPGK